MVVMDGEEHTSPGETSPGNVRTRLRTRSRWPPSGYFTSWRAFVQRIIRLVSVDVVMRRIGGYNAPARQAWSATSLVSKARLPQTALTSTVLECLP